MWVQRVGYRTYLDALLFRRPLLYDHTGYVYSVPRRGHAPTHIVQQADGRLHDGKILVRPIAGFVDPCNVPGTTQSIACSDRPDVQHTFPV